MVKSLIHRVLPIRNVRKRTPLWRRQWIFTLNDRIPRKIHIRLANHQDGPTDQIDGGHLARQVPPPFTSEPSVTPSSNSSKDPTCL